MSTFVRVTLLLWSTCIRRVLITKRMAIVVLGCSVPPAMAWFMLSLPSRGPTPIEAYLYPAWWLTLMLLVPLASVIVGSSVISEEVDDRTITYLLTRPIPRAAVFLGRWLASLTVLLALVGGSVLAHGKIVEAKSGSFVPHADERVEITRRDGRKREITRKGSDPELVAVTAHGRLPDGLLSAVLLAALLGSTAYSAMFAALGTLNKHPMIVGLGYCFAIEGFLTNLPGRSQSLSIQYYVRSYAHAHHTGLWTKLDDLQLLDPAGPAQAVVTLVVVTIVALVIGSIAISRREYVLSA
jgi:hypothetical protein